MKRKLEAGFEVVDVEVVLAVKADEVVAVAFVVAKEEILTVYAAIVFPPLLSLFNGFALGMEVAGEWYLVVAEKPEDVFCARHGWCRHAVGME